MKAKLKVESLHAALRRIRGVIERRVTIPSLANVALTFEKSGIQLRGTDLDMEMSLQVEAEVTDTGATTVSADLLTTFISKLPKGSDVILEDKDSSLKISCGRSRATLQTLPAEDFPDLSAGTTTHQFDGAPVQPLLAKAQFCISTEETRYYLNGVYLHIGNGKLNGVATDGHRLALIQTDIPDGAKGMPGVIVPKKTVAEALKLFDGAKEMQVTLSSGKIRFEADGISLLSKLIDGTFPDYQRVVPENNNNILKLNRLDFAACVDRVSTVAADGRPIRLSIKDTNVKVSTVNADAGTAEEDIDAEYNSDPIDIGFNDRYLGDVLGQIGAEAVQVALADAGSPTIFSAPDVKDEIYVLMPMRV